MSSSFHSAAKEKASTRQVCTFLVNGFLFGVYATRVQEVIRFQPLTKVPLAPPTVSGLLNLRGQIVTTLDLRRMLGFPLREAGAQPMNVVVRIKDSAVSLQVDDVGDVVDVEEASFELPPATLAGRAQALVRGVYKLDGRLLLMLDADRVVRPQVLNVEESQSTSWNKESRRAEHAQ